MKHELHYPWRVVKKDKEGNPLVVWNERGNTSLFHNGHYWQQGDGKGLSRVFNKPATDTQRDGIIGAKVSNKYLLDNSIPNLPNNITFMSENGLVYDRQKNMLGMVYNNRFVPENELPDEWKNLDEYDLGWHIEYDSRNLEPVLDENPVLPPSNYTPEPPLFIPAKANQVSMRQRAPVLYPPLIDRRTGEPNTSRMNYTVPGLGISPFIRPNSKMPTVEEWRKDHPKPDTPKVVSVEPRKNKPQNLPKNDIVLDVPPHQ